MRVFIEAEETINAEDLKKFKNISLYNNEKQQDWKTLWSLKIDYYEYQIEELKNKYPFIYEISDYFIGMTEIAIQLLDNDKILKNNIISHRRTYSSMKKEDLYNPLNIVIDDESRDYAELYKDLIFKGVQLDIDEFINKNNIISLYLFFIRLLYITPFFDQIDNIILKNKDEMMINKILINISFYEEQLSKLYINLYNNKLVPELKFLKKT